MLQSTSSELSNNNFSTIGKGSLAGGGKLMFDHLNSNKNSKLQLQKYSLNKSAVIQEDNSSRMDFNEKQQQAKEGSSSFLAQSIDHDN
jgi:hypothetical protein